MSSSYPIKPNGIINFLPDEIWSRVIPYVDRNEPLVMAKLQRVSRYFRSVIQKEKEFYYKQLELHPMIGSICENSELLQKMTYREKIPYLDQLIKHASAIQSLVKDVDSTPWEVGFSQKIEVIRQSLRTGIAIAPFQLATWKNALKKLSEQVGKVSYDDLFLSSILKNDIAFFSKWKFALIKQLYIDYAACFLLLNHHDNEFRKLLKHTSISNKEDFNLDALTTFLILTLELDRMDLFEELINKKESFFPNHVLVAAVEFNRDKAIRILLKEKLPFYEDFVPDNAIEGNAWHTWGLHTALMIAANQNKMSVMHAILEEKEYIDRQILQHIKDLFENHESQHLLQIYENTDWLERDNHPNREGIIQLLNQEIASRFPDESEEKNTK